MSTRKQVNITEEMWERLDLLSFVLSDSQGGVVRRALEALEASDPTLPRRLAQAKAARGQAA